MSRFPSIATGLALAASLALASTATAQTSLTFVKDINTAATTSTPSSYPYPNRNYTTENNQQWAQMGGWFYFSASTASGGSELYKSNGVVAIRVKDINPGPSSSSPAYFTVVGSKMYFRAYSEVSGTELWVTDGTSAGTKMVKDIRSGSMSSYPYYITRIGSKVCFRADDGVVGAELWISDGTAAGTTLLKDIRPGSSTWSPYSGSPSYMTSTKIYHRVFFYANDGTNGAEPWVTDGTTAGTVMVKNIRSSTSSSYPRYFQPLGATKVVFEANDGTNGTELWISDGTAANTSMVKDVYSGALSGTSLYASSSLGGKVLFRGHTAAAGFEPWITDGTAAGTFLLKDVRSGSLSSYMYYSTTDGAKAYWGCSAAAGSYEIWTTDGTILGTKRYSSAAMSTQRPSYLAATGGKVFFQGYNVTANTGYELCMTDGTTTATLKDIWPGLNTYSRPNNGYASYCSVIGTGKIAFRANDGTNGYELWTSAGTTATTKMIDIFKPTGPKPTANDNVSYIAPLFGKIIFSATDGRDKTKGQKGQELYISDGTTAGTKLLKDIWVGTSTTYASNSYPSYTCRLGNYVYFYANDGVKGYELWRTDGTTAGTTLFKDIRSGSFSSYPRYMTRVKDKIYFQANNGTNGTELWVTDGTVAGTVMVKDIYSGSSYSSSSPSGFARLGNTNKVIFRAYNTGQGQELWISDGTAAGTVLVKDIYGGSSSSYPNYTRSYGNKVYFQARTLAAGTELWVTDGTSLGTKMVKDLVTGKDSSYPSYMEVQNGKLYFYAYSKTFGYELHRSDGTSAGTVLYANFNPGASSTYPRYITAVGSRRIWFQGKYAAAAFGYEPMYVDVTIGSGVIFNANSQGSSYPVNYGEGSYRFAVDSGSIYSAARPSWAYDNQLLRIKNGATAQRIGRAQNSSTMSATDPRIGKNMLLSGKTSVSNPLSVVCLGVPDSKPLGLGTFAPNSFAYFQLTNYFMIIGNMPGIAWATVLPVPNDVTLVGMPAVLQTFSLNAVTFPNGTEATNGIHITIGK